MRTITDALPYAFYASLAICLFLAVRTYVLKSILKKDYEINIHNMDMMELSIFELNMTQKEIKYLIKQFIRAKAWLNIFAIIAFIVFILCLVFCWRN